MAFTIKELLSGGLPDFLDKGQLTNAPTPKNTTQFTERQPPTDLAGVSPAAAAPQPVNWVMWGLVGVAGVTALVLALRR